MSESKVYMFPESGNSGLASMLAPLLQLKGIDPNVLLAMNNRNNGFGGEGGWFIWIIFLFFLMGWNRNGWGNLNGDNGSAQRFYTDSLINNDAGRELLMTAIQGNGTAISQLATTLNCDVNSIQLAVNSVLNQLCQVGSQVGMSSQQVINAIQQGNMSIAQQVSSCCCDLKTQMASCCCDVKDSITRGNYENLIATLNQTNTLQNGLNSVNTSVERGFSASSFESAQLTCSLLNTIKDTGNSNTLAILAKLEQIQTNALQDKVEALREKNSQLAVVINNALQSALFGLMIGQATAPINAALTGLAKEVADVQCKLPNTVTLPYSCATAVPTCLAAQYGLFGNGFNNGYWA